MKNMKKPLYVLAATALLLTACGNNANNSSNPSPTASTPAANQEAVKLTIVAKDLPPDDPNSQKWINGIEDGLKAEGKNVDLEIVPVQSGTYKEKLGLLLQSGTIPDLIYFQGSDYQFAITQKILEDLTPYIAKSQNIQDSMTDFNKERLANYPYLVWLAPINSAIPVVRQDLFDKTTSGKEVLENPTVDNYYKFFKELKEKSGAKFAYTTAGNLDELDVMFAQAFGETATWIKGADGKYEYAKVSQAEKEKLAFYAKLYQEGLLDPDFLTKAWDTKEKSFYDGESAIIAGTEGKVIDIYNNKSTGQNGPAATVLPLPPAKGAAQGYTPVDVSKESRGFAISSTSKNKDLAFAVLDFLASPKGQMLDKLGVEGEEYTIVDNKIKFTDKFQAWYPHFVESTKNFKPAYEFDPSTPYLSEPALKSLEMFNSMATKDNAFIVPEELATQWDAATQVFKAYAADVVTGKKSIDGFADFVESWKAAGGQAVTDYANQNLK